MSIANAYQLHNQINQAESDNAENELTFKSTKYAQWFLTIATTLIYYSFTSVIFAGVSVWAFQDYVLANGGNFNGLLFTIALVVSTPLGLAFAKHGNYRAIARTHDIKELSIRLIMLLALVTGIYYETVSSSSNLQEKAFHSVETSNAGKSILNSGIAISTSSDSGLADAESKLISCKKKLTEGKLKDCDNSQARVDSYKEQAALTRATIADSNAKSIEAKQAALDKERDSRVLPAAKSMAELFNVSLATGTMLIVLISSLFFELIHLTTIFNERKHIAKSEYAKSHLLSLKCDYFKLTNKVYSPSDFKDDSVLDMDDLRENGLVANADFDNEDVGYNITTKGKPFQSNGMGFTSPLKTAHFKYMEGNTENVSPTLSIKHGFGFIPTNSERENKTELVRTAIAKGAYHDAPLDTQVIVKPHNTVNNTVTSGSVLLHSADRVTTQSRPLAAPRNGHCQWCDCELVGMTARAKYCSTQHKDAYWNWKKPTSISKRTERLN